MKSRTRTDYRRAVGGKWERIGLGQFNFLKQQGLRPPHKLLDFGCGSMRGGRYFIDYLDAGNYYGIDISPEVLEAGKKVIAKEGLGDKKPNLLVSQNQLLNGFHSVKFDFINAQSVLSHMPKEDIESLFSNLYKIMKSETKFFATFNAGDKYKSSSDYMDFYYPIEMLRNMAKKHNLSLTIAEDKDCQRRQTIALITLAK